MRGFPHVDRWRRGFLLEPCFSLRLFRQILLHQDFIWLRNGPWDGPNRHEIRTIQFLFNCYPKYWSRVRTHVSELRVRTPRWPTFSSSKTLRWPSIIFASNVGLSQGFRTRKSCPSRSSDTWSILRVTIKQKLNGSNLMPIWAISRTIPRSYEVLMQQDLPK